MDAPRPGSKLQCTSCGAEVVVVKATASTPMCCGKSLALPAPKAATNG